MNVRLIVAIVSDIMEEAAIAVIFLVGLPQLGIHIPLYGLVLIMIAWLALSIFLYRKGSQALSRKPVAGLPTLVGVSGRAVSPLKPEGTVRVHNELWTAKSVSGAIKKGENITVLAQEGLKLTVRRRDFKDIKAEQMD